MLFDGYSNLEFQNFFAGEDPAPTFQGGGKGREKGKGRLGQVKGVGETGRKGEGKGL